MASIGFRWLDILEKEFDKSFVELDLTVGEWESEEPDVVFNIRQKLCSLSSCFAQLTHKAQTIFQNSAKIEAELIHLRTELVESKSKREVLEQELHNFLLQLHSAQLSHLPGSLDGKKQDPNFKPDVDNIRRRLEAELRISPVHINKGGKEVDEIKLSPPLIENAQHRIENAQLINENASLRHSILALNSEVYGAKLAAKYLDKELAGRIQQLQLLGREMRGEIRDKLWRQLESEILLQRHKTVVRACRRNSVLSCSEKSCPKPAVPSSEAESVDENNLEQFGEVRTVLVKRKQGQGLGISITGGREHGVPILISELEPRGPAAMTEKLFIGDAILYVNDKDLRQACHKEAVDILQQQSGDCLLQVQYIAADDSDNSIEEDSYNFRFFDPVESNGGISNNSNVRDVLNTPTAPRTPESSVSRCTSRASIYNFSDPKSLPVNKVEGNRNSSNKLNIYQKVLLDSKITNTSYNFSNVNIGQKETDPTINSNEFRNEINQNIIEKQNTGSSVTPDNKQLIEFNKTSNFLNKIIPFINKDDISVISDILLADNSKDLIQFEDVNTCNNENFNSSLNSLTSENFSSPMQTSTDMILDSEILSTDIASNDSHSPKNLQTDTSMKKLNYIAKFGNVCASNDSLCDPKSDQSLLNSDESCGSSPVRKNKRDFRKPQRKLKKKYFGVKTLQSIFNKHDGYSDVSTTASDYEDEKKVSSTENHKEKGNPKEGSEETTIYKCKAVYTDTSPQFEENVHNILSDIFVKNFPNTNVETITPSVQKPIVNKKYFSFHGQNLRVGKALRLCPNENNDLGNEQRKEKLLARYVYNSNSSSGDGVGDPFFGTPV
ncbi:hypothetical protein WA026_003462 [Henosepilachna vigintioctopunctata]|uniref:PDZ domain-containing protein n=1 Tax=Henosepilachna vigintioctopunctata TaxID=420089 RepID=A0AAW1TJ14_9CUCU